MVDQVPEAKVRRRTGNVRGHRPVDVQPQHSGARRDDLLGERRGVHLGSWGERATGRQAAAGQVGGAVAGAADRDDQGVVRPVSGRGRRLGQGRSERHRSRVSGLWHKPL
jgi:hypothetical protein